MVVKVPTSFAQTVYATINPKLPSPRLPSDISPHLTASQAANPRFLTGILFPLSSDHLITLIQYNVLRACLANLKLLNLVEATNTAEECGQAVVHILTDPVPFSETGQPLIPPPLHPTLLQRTVEHPPWIDIIPHPVWRDNLIRATGTYDADEICNDVVGGLWDDSVTSGPDVSERGIIAWSPPWDMSGWEASEGFLKKWSWLLQGCGDILEHTNKWRRMRGEDDLVIEI